MSTIYLSGPMRGYPMFNSSLFRSAARHLRADGWTVISPHEHDLEVDPLLAEREGYGRGEVTPDMHLDNVLAWDLQQVCTVDAVAMLPRWEHSVGARLEHEAAEATGREVYLATPRVGGWQLTKEHPSVIIGLSGYAGAGKDTVALALCREHGFTRVAFADALRQFAENLNPLVETPDGIKHLGALLKSHGWDRAKREVPAVRRVLQDIGLEVRDVVGVDAWVDVAMKAARGQREVVITDVRFPNEATAIKNAGGHVVRLDRSGVGPINSHPSERSMDDWQYDARVGNDGEPGETARVILGVLGL